MKRSSKQNEQEPQQAQHQTSFTQRPTKLDTQLICLLITADRYFGERQDGRISISGGGPSLNAFMVDGTANKFHTSGGSMVTLSPDAVEEIRIVTAMRAPNMGAREAASLTTFPRAARTNITDRSGNMLKTTPSTRTTISARTPEEPSHHSRSTNMV